MSKTTVTALDQRRASEAVLRLAFELGKSGWPLGFSTGFGQPVLRRKVASCDCEAVLRAIEWARRRLGCEKGRVVSCYEVGRDGFRLHRWLSAEGIENRIIDSSSIEVNGRKKRARTDRLDVAKLLGLLARFMAGLIPMPFDSGGQRREQGIGKDGSRWVRAVAVDQAWAWIRFPPESALSKWYQQRFGHGSTRLRKIGIVALARKLLIALWHWVEHGVLPEGAVLKTHLRLA